MSDRRQGAAASTRGRRHRPLGAHTRAVDSRAVVVAASKLYLAGRPIDMSELAAGLGVGRATLYRRVGKHEDLLATVLAEQADRTFRALAVPPGEPGLDTLCETLARFIEAIVTAPPLLALIRRDPVLFVRVVLGPGAVEDRATAIVQDLIEHHLGSALSPPARLLARAVIRMSDGMMYSHLLADRPTEVDDLLSLIRLLLAATSRSGNDTQVDAGRRHGSPS